MINPQMEVREGIDFGLGWIVFQNLPNDEFTIFNAGSDQGMNALVILFPKSKKGLIVFTNGDNGRGIAMKLIASSFQESGKEILKRF